MPNSPMQVQANDDNSGNDDEPATSKNDEDLREESFAIPTMPKRRNKEQTVYVIEFETEADEKGEGHRIRGAKGMQKEKMK